MKRTSMLSTLILIAGLPLGALAATPAQTPAGGAASEAAPASPGAGDEVPPMFKELDRNHDNYVSKAEARRSADVKSRFKELDTNHDGKISVDEFKKGTEAKM